MHLAAIEAHLRVRGTSAGQRESRRRRRGRDRLAELRRGGRALSRRVRRRRRGYLRYGGLRRRRAVADDVAARLGALGDRGDRAGAGSALGLLWRRRAQSDRSAGGDPRGAQRCATGALPFLDSTTASTKLDDVNRAQLRGAARTTKRAKPQQLGVPELAGEGGRFAARTACGFVRRSSATGCGAATAGRAARRSFRVGRKRNCRRGWSATRIRSACGASVAHSSSARAAPGVRVRVRDGRRGRTDRRRARSSGGRGGGARDGGRVRQARRCSSAPAVRSGRWRRSTASCICRRC